MDVRSFVDFILQENTPNIFRDKTLKFVLEKAAQYRKGLHEGRLWRIISSTALLPFGGVFGLLFYGGADKPLSWLGSLLLASAAITLYWITHRKSLRAYKIKNRAEFELEPVLNRFKKAGELIGEPGILNLEAKDVIDLCTRRYHELRSRGHMDHIPVRGFGSEDQLGILLTTFVGICLPPVTTTDVHAPHERTLSLVASK